MKGRLLSLLSFCLLSGLANAAGNSSYHLDKAPLDLSDKPSLQRGAKYFVNYCMGCHSMAYLRYNRLARDLGLTDREVEDNLIFTQDEEGSPTKVGELMTIAMDKFYAEASFGVVPPDLTLTARSRGADWIYTYMRTFYVDKDAQWGVNNAVFPDVGMPHVLWELQGLQRAVYDHQAGQQSDSHTIVGFEQVSPGALSSEEYDQVVADITNFMTYAAEPAKMQRYKTGAWVLFYLVLLTGVFYLLKQEYWRDIK